MIRFKSGGLRRCVRRALQGTAILFLALVLYIVVENLTGNFHEVLPKEFYRAGQPTGDDIAQWKDRYGIRSILNLRGENKGSDWYDAEVKAARDAGIRHMDFRMSAARELTEQEALALIEMMRNAPKPLLIHCRSGSDRTGLAAALYIAAVAKKGEEAAEQQLWIDFGHMPFYFNDSFAMNRTFEALEPMLGFPDS